VSLSKGPDLEGSLSLSKGRDSGCALSLSKGRLEARRAIQRSTQ
jgi:hypothetical protein